MSKYPESFAYFNLSQKNLIFYIYISILIVLRKKKNRFEMDLKLSIEKKNYEIRNNKPEKTLFIIYFADTSLDILIQKKPERFQCREPGPVCGVWIWIYQEFSQPDPDPTAVINS